MPEYKHPIDEPRRMKRRPTAAIHCAVPDLQNGFYLTPDDNYISERAALSANERAARADGGDEWS